MISAYPKRETFSQFLSFNRDSDEKYFLVFSTEKVAKIWIAPLEKLVLRQFEIR